ncbi:phospholipase D-like domain-containing protein [Streptomyces sp. NPDC051940]|uniref:phospholipase D-like domain-containing protein n=1 Tax=Streptomyces sp. NPDC051940 TaxID=3155675 RepID=UPI00342BD478
MRSRSRWLLGLAAATGLIVSGTGTPALADDAQIQAVTTTAVFNDPGGSTADQDRIRDHIVGLVNGAAAGSSIKVSMFSWTDNVMTDALVAAKGRGVSVKVIVDYQSSVGTGAEYTRLVSGLGTDRAQSSWVLRCPSSRACIGARYLPSDSDGPINHNKFFTFSSTNGTSNVVVQSSANQTGIQRTDLFNNAVTIVDSGLYAIYNTYWNDQLKYGTAASGLNTYYQTPESATGPYKTYFFPRQEQSGTEYNNNAATDTVKLILDNVSCASGTEIRMAANLFTRDEVASKLVSMVNAGCKVYLAHDASDPASMSDSVESIISGKLTTRVQCNEVRTGQANAGLHSKYFLVDGTYNGTANRQLVFTGSHNYSYPALRANDETLLKIENSTLYAQYKANHDRLMSYCAGS